MYLTRYETAWQNLILEEDRLRKKKGEKEIFTGTLVCKINSSSHKLEYDAWEDNLNQYVRKTVKLSGGNEKLKQTSSDKTTIGELTRMAMEYPFLAYTISYKFDADTTSLILGGDDPFKLDVMFYPFSRPFFHVAEKLLDDKLFNLLLKKANPKP